MNFSCYVHLWLLLSFGLLSPLFAQTAISTEKVIPEVEVDNLVQGRFYSPHYPGILGSQFLTESWIEGDFRLWDKDYLGMPLTFDLYTNDLILLYKTKVTLHFIRLDKKQVQQFRMGQQYFINTSFSSYKNMGLQEGYYEVILEDKLSFLIKRQLDKKTNNAIYSFIRNDKKYLILEGRSHLCSNKKSLLKAVGKQYKKQLKTFLKKNKIYLKKASDEEWTKVVIYLNEVISN